MRSRSLLRLTGLVLALLHPAGHGTLGAQQVVHPREMSLPTPAFRRPDPAAHRHQVGPLLVYVAEDRRVPLVTVSAFVRVGFGDAPSAALGRAVERALRAGPAALAPGAFGQELALMVAEWRVSMGAEVTELSLDVPVADATRAIELVVQTLRAPRLGDVAAGRPPSALRSMAATGESGPVLYEGSLQLAADLFTEWELGTHPYGGLAGEAVSGAAARDFHRAWFAPSQVTLAVGGDIGAAAVRSAVASAVAGWSGDRPPARRPATPLAARAAGREIRLFDTNKLQGWVVMGHALPPVPVADRAALEVMNYILGGGHFDTRLFRELRDKRGLANTGGGYPEWFARGPGSYTLRTYGRPEVIPLLVELTIAEADRMRREPVTEDELQIARGALADGVFAIRYADGYATARSLAEEWARNGHHEESATYQRRIGGVTREQVAAAARRYLDPDRFRIVILGPQGAIAKASHPESTKGLAEMGRVTMP